MPVPSSASGWTSGARFAHAAGVRVLFYSPGRVKPPPRKIVHVDMDAFYASVEQRDRPELRGKPVIVGGQPDSRGVVCTASYEARQFGVRSAMPTAQAYRLCPHGVFLRPDFPRYKEASRTIQAIFREVTELVEPLSLDEAYLDVSQNHLDEPSATRVAAHLRARIREQTALTASAGVAPNKFLAKVASDLDKPDGLTVIPPERVPELLAGLPVRKLPGIGRVGAERCARHGIERVADFLRHDLEQLVRWFGSSGPRYLELARGVDERPVRPGRERKSVSIEDTFAEDVVARAEAAAILDTLAERLAERLRLAEARGRTVVLKVKYADFQQVTRSRTLSAPTRAHTTLSETALALLDQTEVGGRPVRLLGIGVSNLDEPSASASAQLVLFDPDPP
ncbi:MAG: DNA polymerase IV [Planctomycetes bacterium]|nr:DNA polymerase IV [Planctomycetota bacterium]